MTAVSVFAEMSTFYQLLWTFDDYTCWIQGCGTEDYVGITKIGPKYEGLLRPYLFPLAYFRGAKTFSCPLVLTLPPSTHPQNALCSLRSSPCTAYAACLHCFLQLEQAWKDCIDAKKGKPRTESDLMLRGYYYLLFPYLQVSLTIYPIRDFNWLLTMRTGCQVFNFPKIVAALFPINRICLHSSLGQLQPYDRQN